MNVQDEMGGLHLYLQLVYNNFSLPYLENCSMFEIAKEWEKGNRNMYEFLHHEKEGYLLKNWFQASMRGQDVFKFVKNAENLLSLICSRFDMGSLPALHEDTIGEYLFRHGEQFNIIKDWAVNNITQEDLEQCYNNEHPVVPVYFNAKKEQERKKDNKVLLRKNVQSTGRTRGQASVNNVYTEEKKSSVRSLAEIRKIMGQN